MSAKEAAADPAVPSMLSNSAVGDTPTSAPLLSVKNSMGCFLTSADFMERTDLEEGGRSVGAGTEGRGGASAWTFDSPSDSTVDFAEDADPTRLIFTLIVSVVSSLISSKAS